jgi:hypothetical protein
MTKEEIVKKFTDYPSYLKKGNAHLAEKFGITEEEMSSIRKDLKPLKEDIHKDAEVPEFENLTLDKVWIKTDGFSALYKNDSVIEKDVFADYQQFLKDFTYPEPIVYENEDLNDHNDAALLVCMADKHIGANTTSMAMVGNEYNSVVLQERMDATLQEIFWYACKHGRFERLVIFDLGDLVDGMDGKTSRGGHSLPQNMSNREVFNVFIQTHTEFFTKLVGMNIAQTIEFRTTGDSNHGSDFEHVCYRSLEVFLNSVYPQVNVVIGNRFIEHFTYGENCIIICHGKDSIDMKRPLPRQLDEKTEVYFKSYIDYNKLNSFRCTVIKADQHYSNTEQGRFFRYKNVLSMFGSSKWVQTNFMVNQPGVDFEIIFKDKPRIISGTLNF